MLMASHPGAYVDSGESAASEFYKRLAFDMKSCPKCGAENRQTASECRLCATPLESAEDLLVVRAETGFEGEIPPSLIVSGDLSAGHGAPVSSQEDLICPNCQGANDPDWLFCQQCGAKLVKPEPAAQASHPNQPGLPDQLAAPSQSAAPEQAHGAVPVPAASAQQEMSEAALASRVSRLSAPAFLTSPERPTPVPLDDPVHSALPAQAVAPSPTSDHPGLADGSQAPESSATTAPAPPRGQEPVQPRVQSAQAAPNPVVPSAPGVCCVNCGEHLVVGAMFCASCGVKISGPGAGPAPRAIGMAVIEMITDGGQVGDTYAVPSGGIHIGRVEGEVTFPHDGYMSGRHAQIMERDGQYYLTDQNSRNGTFIRIRGEVELKPGDTFLVGKQVFRFGRK